MLREEFLNQKMMEAQALSRHEDDLDVNDDIWRLSQSIRFFREELKEFEEETHRKINEQMCTLEGLIMECDSLLYNVCELYCERAKEENDTPEHP